MHVLLDVIPDSPFVRSIKEECAKNTKAASEYMKNNIEEMFPEITKAIQERRAKYYVLIRQGHYVEDMLKKGQLDEIEAG